MIDDVDDYYESILLYVTEFCDGGDEITTIHDLSGRWRRWLTVQR